MNELKTLKKIFCIFSNFLYEYIIRVMCIFNKNKNLKTFFLIFFSDKIVFKIKTDKYHC